MWCCSNFCTIQSKWSIVSRCQSLTCRLSAMTWSDIVKPLSITYHSKITCWKHIQKSWKHRMLRPMWHLHVTVTVYTIASIQGQWYLIFYLLTLPLSLYLDFVSLNNSLNNSFTINTCKLFVLARMIDRHHSISLMVQASG